MKQFLFLLVGSLLLAGAAQAQGSFRFGPRVGGSVATAYFPDAGRGTSYTSRVGFEAGLTGSVSLGRFALQPSLLFSQKGYGSAGTLPSFDTPVTYEEQVRLNYLVVPLNVAFALGRAGQGLHVFAGPYVSLLVGGSYAQQVHVGAYLGGSAYDVETTGKVHPASRASDYSNRYSRRFDTGLQAGLGYRRGGWLVQAGYSVGLRNLGVPRQLNGYTYEAAAYYNRAFQAALSYLVGAKS